MSRIESSPYPLAFRPDRMPDAGGVSPDMLRLRTQARALAGMQKEAVVTCEPGGRRWRMVCDEGPYLNGTDLAPFPLAYFSTGLANAFLAEIVQLARARGIDIDGLEVVEDSYYTMQGSAVRGDMLGGALPVELTIRCRSRATEADVRQTVMEATQRGAVQALLGEVLASEFALRLNGNSVEPDDVGRWDNPDPFDLSQAMFDGLRPDADDTVPSDLVTKAEGARTVFNTEGGAGSSLAADQKRTLHVRGIATLRDDGLSDTLVQLFRPIGSHFRFLCDVTSPDHGGERAPAPLVYLSAGIAFCYLTQIGRYVAILKLPLDRYAIGQVTAFRRAGDPAAADGGPAAWPVRTLVELDTPADEEVARRMVMMGERTCFLHAAARTALKTRVRIEYRPSTGRSSSG